MLSEYLIVDAIFKLDCLVTTFGLTVVMLQLLGIYNVIITT